MRMRLIGVGCAVLLGACTVLPSQPILLPPHPRIGLIDLTSKEAKIVHVGTTMFTNIEGAALKPPIDMRDFFEHRLDTRITELYGEPLAVKGDQVAEAALSTQRMDNAFLVGNTKISTTLVSELRKNVVSSIDSFGLQHKLDLVIVVWTYPSLDNISGSSVEASDYGLFTANRFGVKRIAAYAHVAVAFVNPRSDKLGECGVVERPTNTFIIPDVYEEGADAISPELQAMVQSDLELLFDQNAAFISRCIGQWAKNGTTAQ